MFCSNQLGNGRQMDLSGPGIDVKLKERKKDLKKFTSKMREIFNFEEYYLSLKIQSNYNKNGLGRIKNKLDSQFKN